MEKVVITGANRGVGLALVKKYLTENYEVIALCRAASEALRATGAKIIEGVDVTDIATLEKVAANLGEVDILINNAGVLYNENLENLSFEHIQQQVEVNTYAPLKVAMTLGKKLKRSGVYAIITSRMGSISDNNSGSFYGYRLSKAAANAVGKSLSIDFKSEEVTVLMLHPGYVKTDMTSQLGDIDTSESAAGLLKVIKEHRSLSETGTFWHTNGDSIPW